MDDLCVLPTVGPAKQNTLREQGYTELEDLAIADPFQLKQDCGLVLSSATQIISGALDELEVECPECDDGDFIPEWSNTQKKDFLGINGPVDVICNSCDWYGDLDETVQSDETLTTFN